MKEHSYPQQSSKSANWNHQDLLCKKLLLIVKLWFWRHLNWIYLHWRMFCTLCACTPWSDAQSEFCERKGKGSINWKKQKWKQAKRKGCINWHKKMEQNKESWALRQKKVVRLSEHGIQNKTNDQFLFEAGICFIFHIERERNLPLRSNLEFDPFWLLHLTIRSTMGTFVIFKLSPPPPLHPPASPKWSPLTGQWGSIPFKDGRGPSSIDEMNVFRCRRRYHPAE